MPGYCVVSRGVRNANISLWKVSYIYHKIWKRKDKQQAQEDALEITILTQRMGKDKLYAQCLLMQYNIVIANNNNW